MTAGSDSGPTPSPAPTAVGHRLRLDRLRPRANIAVVRPRLRLMFIGLTAGVLLFRLAASVIWNRGPVFDEQFHLPVIEQFGPGLPSIAKLSDYASATGPLFYVVFGNIGRVLGYNRLLLRLVIFVSALGSLYLFHRILRLAGSAEPWPSVALLATTPYFFTLSGLVMTELPALMFGLLSVYAWLRFRAGGRTGDYLLALLAAVLAIWTRQYFVFLPVAFALSELTKRPRRWIATFAGLVPGLALVPLVLLWHGLVPPELGARYHPRPQLENITSVLVWTGLYLLPWIFRRPRLWHLGALAAVPVVVLAPSPGLGFTRTVLNVLPEPLPQVVAAILAVAGLLVYLHRIGDAEAGSNALRLSAFAAFAIAGIIICGGPTTYERFILPAYAMLLLGVRPDCAPTVALLWAALLQLPLATYHLLHLIAR